MKDAKKIGSLSIAKQNLRSIGHQQKQLILSRILCKNTESLQQAGNDKTANLRDYTCKESWDGLYPRYTFSNKYHQNGQIKGPHNEQSNRKTNGQEKRCRCVSFDHLNITSNKFPIGISLPRLKNSPWRWVFLNKRQRGQQHMHLQKKRKIDLCQRSHLLMINMMRNDGGLSQRLARRFENGLGGQVN